MSSAINATAELCIEGLADDQAATDLLSDAAEPSDRGPGDYLGPPSLAAALFGHEPLRPSISTWGRCWSGVIELTHISVGAALMGPRSC